MTYSQVTAKHLYLNRRKALAAAVAALGRPFSAHGAMRLSAAKTAYSVGNERVTPSDVVTGYNNFYEFGTSKEQPAQLARNFQTRPWTLRIEGEVLRPKTLDLDAV